MTFERREHTVVVTATPEDLPPVVADALAHPPRGRPGRVEAAGHDWATTAWGDEASEPLLLVHGVTSQSNTFWRVGPAVAASGRFVVAVDLPGHGETATWHGRHRHADTSADLAAFIRAAGLERPELAVLGHSWGGMVVAGLPSAGIRPRVLILLDPPHLTRDQLEQLTRDPTERRYDTFEEARAVIRRVNPSWSAGDVEAKAMSLTQFDPGAVLSVLVENGDWDAGLAALDAPEAAGIEVWYVRGELSAGGMIPEPVLPKLAARAGTDHVLTIAGGPHSPQRTHPEATTLAILRALGR